MRIVTTAPGLGDCIWVVQKLINANEKFIFRMPDGQPQRAHQLWELLPQITHSWYYDRIRFSNIRAWNNSKARGGDLPRFKDMHNNDLFLEANTLLESGQRLENFLPDLPISFRLTYETTQEHKKRADELLLPIQRKRVGIYMSSIGTNTASGTWLAEGWKEFLSLMQLEFNCRFVFFAAKWDEDLFNQVVSPANDETFDVFYDEPLGAVIEAMKQLDYFIGFQSGMNIINETLGKDGMMLYRKADSKIIGTYADPKRIESGAFKECLFDTPENIFNWIKDNKKL